MSDRETLNQNRLKQLRERFGLSPRTASWLALPVRAYGFFKLALAKARTDHLAEQSASLAFITIVSLVPLLAALSFLSTRWFSANQAWLVGALSQVLPYSESRMLSNLEQFLIEAQAIKGIGFLAFIVTAMMVFGSIEHTVNRIWNVPRLRSFRSRLLSFTLVLFWGPFVLGTSYSFLFYLEQEATSRYFAESLPVQLIPFIVTVTALTMLYWLVPFTEVWFRAAFAGGLTAALLLEILRQVFGVYVSLVRGVSIIYGGFGLVLFFMISIQVAWLIVLLGAEVSYAFQNAGYLSRPRRSAAPLEGSWLGLAAAVFITERFHGGRPIVPHELLAEHLRLEAEDVGRILEPLVDAGFIEEVSGEADGYLLSSDPYRLEVSRILETYDRGHVETLESYPSRLADGLEDLRARLVAARARETSGLVLARLVRDADAKETMPERAAVASAALGR